MDKAFDPPQRYQWFLDSFVNKFVPTFLKQCSYHGDKLIKGHLSTTAGHKWYYLWVGSYLINHVLVTSITASY